MNRKIRKFPTGLLTVDPGDNTGWAFWVGDGQPIVGQINSKKKGSKIDQVCLQVQRFEELILHLQAQHEIKRILIEDVTVYRGSIISMASATRGNIFKLAFIIGGYLRICYTLGIAVDLILARDWKGQMDDGAVARRVEMILGNKYQSFHIYDAVGIGLDYINRFKKIL